MKPVKIHEAKTNFSKLIAAVEAGEVVTVQRGNTPWRRSFRTKQVCSASSDRSADRSTSPQALTRSRPASRSTRTERLAGRHACAALVLERGRAVVGLRTRDTRGRRESDLRQRGVGLGDGDQDGSRQAPSPGQPAGDPRGAGVPDPRGRRPARMDRRRVTGGRPPRPLRQAVGRASARRGSTRHQCRRRTSISTASPTAW